MMQYLTQTILLAVCLAVFAVPFASAQNRDGSDLFVVIVNDKRGYIDRTGKVIIEPKWGGANNFSEGLAVVATYEDGYKQGYIDTTGKVVIEPQFRRAWDFSEGLAAVGFGEFGLHNSGEHKTGFIDKTGKLVIEPKYTDARSFSEGLAVVYEDGKYGYIDKTGKLVIPLKFDSAMDFSEGLASVRIKKKWGYIDHSGKFVVSPKYSFADSLSEGLAAVKTGGAVVTGNDWSEFKDDNSPEIWMYINRHGKVVIKLPINTDSANRFSEEVASVAITKQDGYLYEGYIDKTGKFIIEPVFGSADDFSDGIARILKDDNFGFIDKKGKILMSFRYKSDYAMVGGFRNGLAKVQKGGEDVFKNFREARYGYIDITGKVIWEPSK